MSVSVALDGFPQLRIGPPPTPTALVGAPQRDVSRYAILKRAGQRPEALFEVFSNDMHASLTASQQPFLDDHVVAQLPDDAVTVIDLTTEADWSDSQGLDSVHTAAAIVHSLPIGAQRRPLGGGAGGGGAEAAPSGSSHSSTGGEEEGAEDEDDDVAPEDDDEAALWAGSQDDDWEPSGDE